ncbi:MAG: carbohydrate ABC transporter permease, partial [Chloroflexota bacterium]
MSTQTEGLHTGATRAARRPSLLPYALAAPTAIFIGLLLLYPILQGIYTSFTVNQLLSSAPPRWVGLANYERMLADVAFWHSVVITLWYTVLVVVTVIVTALLVALL